MRRMSGRIGIITDGSAEPKERVMAAVRMADLPTTDTDGLVMGAGPAGLMAAATAPAARPGRRGRSAATSRARAPTATASPSAAAACPAKYSPNLGGHPSPAPCRIPRPRTSRPDGSGRAPCDCWDQRCTWPRVTGPPHRPQSPIRYRDGGDTVRRRDCRAREAAGGRTATANQDFLAFFFPILGKRFFTAALTFFCSAGVPC